MDLGAVVLSLEGEVYWKKSGHLSSEGQLVKRSQQRISFTNGRTLIEGWTKFYLSTKDVLCD